MYENGSNRTIIALFQHERTNVYSICYFGSLIRFPHFIIMVGEPPSLPPLTARRWFFVIQNFEQLALALKNRVCSELFHCVEIFLIFQDFWATLHFSKKTVFPWIFHCIEIFVIFQDFWATCACPENRVCPETFEARDAATLPDPPPCTPVVSILLADARRRDRRKWIVAQLSARPLLTHISELRRGSSFRKGTDIRQKLSINVRFCGCVGVNHTLGI